jgi:hypothetical protein
VYTSPSNVLGTGYRGARLLFFYTPTGTTRQLFFVFYSIKAVASMFIVQQ